MADAAVLGAPDVERPGGRRLEPGGVVAPGQHVLLHAKRGDVEAVDDVARGHHELDRTTHRDGQDVHRRAPVRVRELPHPLLGRHVDGHGIGRRRHHAVVLGGSHDPEDDEDGQQTADERELAGRRGLDPRGQLSRPLAPAPDEKDERQEEDEGRPQHRGAYDEVVEHVHAEREGRGLRRQVEEGAEQAVHRDPRSTRSMARSIGMATSPASRSTHR